MNELMNLKKLQWDIKVWQQQNFPKERNLDCLLGVFKELGYLAGALSYHRNGIRIFAIDKTKENILSYENEIGYKLKDIIREKIADTAIFLIGMCIEQELDFQEILENRWNAVKERNWQAYPINGINK